MSHKTMARFVEVYKFPRMAGTALVAQGLFISENMKENVALFPQPEPTIDRLDAAIENLHKKLFAAGHADRLALSGARAAKKEVAGMLQKLGGYVNFVCESRVDAIKSGFDLIAERGRGPKIAYVPAPTLSGDLSSIIHFKIPAVRGARMYKFCITLDPLLPVHQWPSAEQVKAKHTFENLVSGQRYHCCVAASASDGNWVYGQAISRVAL